MSVSTFTSGSGNWVADDTVADIELWGGGGAGANGSAGVGGGGGGGGEYIIKHVTGLTIGNSYAYVVGAAGSDSTMVIGATTYRAHHGGIASGSTGAAGGTGGNGDTNRNGGNGGSNGGGAGTGGGGGGSSAGTAAVGNNGSGNTGGTGGAGGTAVTGGGGGGAGGNSSGSTNGTAGTAPGGGGGGGGGPGTAGAGAAGQVRVTTNPPPAINVGLELSTRPLETSFEMSFVQGFNLDFTLSTRDRLSPALGSGTNTDVGLELSTRPVAQNFPLEIQVGQRIDLTLSTRTKISPELQFAYTINLTLSTRPTASFPLTVVWGTVMVMSLSTRQRIDPSLAVLYGITFALELSTRSRRSGELWTWISTPSATKYIQAHRSGVTQIIFGATVGEPFLLNKAATAYRRRAKHQLLHTGKVKPAVEEIDAVFTIMTPTGDLQPDEFMYEAPGGYLRIRNANILYAMLTQDGDTAAIPITETKVDITQSLFLTGFHQDGEKL